jgi:WD40 repeat protein
LTLLLALLLVGTVDEPKPIPVVTPTPVRSVSYEKDVAAILDAKCTGCHSSVLAENRLNMEQLSGMLKGGKRGPALVPGNAEASLLFRMAAHRVEPVMPPAKKKEAAPLTGEELGLLKLWIDAGAKDDSGEEPEAPITLGALPPGLHPIVAVDMLGDGRRVVCGRANVVEVYDADSGMEIIALGGHKDIIQSLRFSPDGRRLAAGGYQIVTMWNVPTGGLESTFLGHTDEVKALAQHGDVLYSGGLDGTVRVWSDQGKPFRQFKIDAQVLALAVSPDGKTLAVGGSDQSVRIVDATDGKEHARLTGHQGPVCDVAYLPDARRVVSVSADGSGRVWSLATREPIALGKHKGPVRAVAVAPDGLSIITGGDDGVIQSWHAEDGRASRTIATLEAPVLSLAVSSDGRLLLAGSADGTARVFDLKEATLLRALRGHPGPVQAVGFSPDGHRLVTAGAEGAIKVWETATGQGVIAFGHTPPSGDPPAPVHSVRRVLFRSDRSLVSASTDRTLKSWRFEGSWSALKSLGPHAFRVLALDFNSDGTLLAAGGGEPSRSGEIQIWEVGKGMHVRTLNAIHSDTVFGLKFSPDGSKLASAGADRFLKVTRTADGKELKAFEGHTHHVLAVDWKSDGKQIVTGAGDSVMKVWDFDSGEQLRTLQAAGKQVTAVRWVPGKAEVAGASGDKLVRFWSPDSGAITRTFSGPSDFVFGVAVSDDGSRVAAGGADGALFLWDGRNGKILRRLGSAAPN